MRQNREAGVCGVPGKRLGPWGGFVIIRVSGLYPERFMNQAVGAGVPLHNVERPAPDMLVATIHGHHFRRVRDLARRHRQEWKVVIVQRLGFAFALHRLLRRKTLVIGGLVALLALYVLSSYVWFVEVRGALDVPKNNILAVARRAGLRPGVPKSGLSLEGIEREIILGHDRLAWVNVELWGTLATINVAERVVPEHDRMLPGDVIAAEDGVIEKLVVLAGIPMVQEGEPVTAGQLLISGLIPPQAPEHKTKLAKGEPPYLHAQGIVRARVWHEGTAEGAMTRQEGIPTGRVQRRLLWQWGERVAHPPDVISPFKAFTQESRSWRLWPLPAAITFLRREEVKLRSVTLPPDVVEEKVLDAAWEQVRQALPAGAALEKPARIEMETVLVEDVEIFRAKVTVEAVRDIHHFHALSEPSMTGPVGSFAQPVPGP